MVGLLPCLAGCTGPNFRAPTPLDAYLEYSRPVKSVTEPQRVVVKVSQRRQRVYVMEGDQMLLAMPVGIGAPETPTPRGEFKILEMDRRRRSNELGFAVRGNEIKRTQRKNVPGGWRFVGAPLPYWCGLGNGIAFHGGWVRHEPTTDGSVRMHWNLAPEFFRLVKIGTPVTISYALPEDDLIGAIPLPPDAGPLPDFPLEVYLGDGLFSGPPWPQEDGMTGGGS